MVLLHISTFLVVLINVKGDCGTLPAVDNASNNATGTQPFTNGTSVAYRCNAGFTEAGTSRIYECTGTSWVGEYSCDEIFCGYIDPPNNGRVTNNPTYKIGTVMQFACNEGYTRSGDASIVCRVDGNWSPNTAPTCNAANCGEFSDIANGNTFQDAGDGVPNDYGSVVNVECNANFIVNGPPHVSCGANGQWGTRPTCDRITCPTYPGLSSSCIEATELSSGTMLYIFCREGQNVSVTETGSAVVECVNNAWDDTTRACYCDCKISADRDVVSLNNLNAKGFLQHGVQLNWSCKNGATKSTNAPLVCTDGNVGTPVCTPPGCGNRPPIINNSTNNATGIPPFAAGTSVEYSCNSGFRGVGNSTKYTCSGPLWVGQYRCDEIVCVNIDPPNNGRVNNNPTFKNGTFIEFACNDGYILNGGANLECRNGSWSPIMAPTCIAVNCGAFPDIANGNTFQNASGGVLNDYGSVVNVECNPNFIVNGSRHVSCDANGQWGTRPTCEPTTCPPYPHLNLSCIGTIEFTGTRLSLVCREEDNVSVTKKGPGSVDCVGNEWNDTTMACFCDCKIDADLNVVNLTVRKVDYFIDQKSVFESVSLDNLNAKGFLPHGAKLKWSCKSGTKSTNSTLVCHDGNAALVGTFQSLPERKPLCTQRKQMPDTSKGNSACNVTGIHVCVCFCLVLFVLVKKICC